MRQTIIRSDNYKIDRIDDSGIIALSVDHKDDRFNRSFLFMTHEQIFENVNITESEVTILVDRRNLLDDVDGEREYVAEKVNEYFGNDADRLLEIMISFADLVY